MTLIIGLISEEYVLLASDRRITWISGPDKAKTEDTENKAVLLAGQFLLGYTGFARLGPRGKFKTEQWIVDQLRDVQDPSDYFQTIAAKAGPAIAAMGKPVEESGHAFIAVGFGTNRGDAAGPQAVGVTISNALGGGYGSWKPRQNFEVTRTSPLNGSNDFRLTLAGLVPPTDHAREAIDLIRRYRKHDPSRILGVAQILVRLIRSVRHEGVGEDISVSVLPRSAVPASHLTAPLDGLKDPVKQLTCVFVPKDTDPDSASVYLPAAVYPGMATFGGEVWAGDQPPPWWRAGN